MKIHPSFLLKLSPLFILFAVGCGDQSSEATLTTNMDIHDSLATLPICDASIAGKMVFVSDSAAVYYCANGDWSPLSGKDGKDGKGCTAAPVEEGFTIVCGGKLIGTLYNGTDGLQGVKGEDGKDGINGTNGTNGKDGLNGTDGKDGINGTNGKDGADGQDGTSCEAIAISNGFKILCDGQLAGILLNGTDGVDGKDGKDGIDGTNGVDGKDGTNGKDGVDGVNGKDGVDGINGTNGKDGVDGKDGKDGTSCNIQEIENGYNVYCGGVLSGTLVNGTDGVDGKDGKDGTNGKDGVDGKDGTNGKDGVDGVNGKDGTSCTAEEAANGFSIICDGKVVGVLLNGIDGKDGKDGTNGINGIDGKDGQDGESCTAEATENGFNILCGGDVVGFVSNGNNGNNGADGKDGADGQNGQDGESCTAKAFDEGYYIVCGGTNVGTLYNGKDGADGKGSDVDLSNLTDDQINTLVNALIDYDKSPLGKCSSENNEEMVYYPLWNRIHTEQNDYWTCFMESWHPVSSYEYCSQDKYYDQESLIECDSKNEGVIVNTTLYAEGCDAKDYWQCTSGEWHSTYKNEYCKSKYVVRDELGSCDASNLNQMQYKFINDHCEGYHYYWKCTADGWKAMDEDNFCQGSSFKIDGFDDCNTDNLGKLQRSYYDGVCNSKEDTEWLCTENGWTPYSSEEFCSTPHYNLRELGECSSKNLNEKLAYELYGGCGNSNSYWKCTEDGWITIDYEDFFYFDKSILGECTEENENEFKQENICNDAPKPKCESYWKCTDNYWISVTEDEYYLHNSECKKDGSLLDYGRYVYVCDNDDYRVVNQIEKIFQLGCTSYNENQQTTYKGNSFKCIDNRWRLVTTTGTITDSQGNSYSTAIIGTQTWMTQNLRYTDVIETPNLIGTYHSAEEEIHENVQLFFPTEHDMESSSTAYGLLYTWTAANNVSTDDCMNSRCTISNTKGICPIGWHIPSRAEWDILIDFVNSITGSESLLFDALVAQGQNGLDLVNFNGYRTGWYDEYQIQYSDPDAMIFWTSENYTAKQAYFFGLGTETLWGDPDDGGNGEDGVSHYYKMKGFSVRCVKD